MQIRMAFASLAQSGTTLAIAPGSRFNLVLRVLQAHEPTFVQTLLAQPSSKAFDHRVIGWFAW